MTICQIREKPETCLAKSFFLLGVFCSCANDFDECGIREFPCWLIYIYNKKETRFRRRHWMRQLCDVLNVGHNKRDSTYMRSISSSLVNKPVNKPYGYVHYRFYVTTGMMYRICNVQPVGRLTSYIRLCLKFAILSLVIDTIHIRISLAYSEKGCAAPLQ